jgi:hypothetical protein
MLSEAQEKRLIEAKARLASGECYPSADAYYQDKDDVRRLEAQKIGKSPRQTDPAGYWYGGQSN